MLNLWWRVVGVRVHYHEIIIVFRQLITWLKDNWEKIINGITLIPTKYLVGSVVRIFTNVLLPYFCLFHYFISTLGLNFFLFNLVLNFFLKTLKFMFQCENNCSGLNIITIVNFKTHLDKQNSSLNVGIVTLFNLDMKITVKFGV